MINNQNTAKLQQKKLQETRTPEQLLLAAHDQQAAAATAAPVQLQEMQRDVWQPRTEGSDNAGSEPSTYQALLDNILNRKGYSYDHTQDPVWSAYAKAYRREGDRATEDTLAAASAATGGVPSSYAVTAANQAGDYYAAQLTDKIPELEQNAYQRYLQELDLDYQALSAAQTERNLDYNRYLQELDQKQQEFSNALALYQTLGYMTPEIEAALGLKKSSVETEGLTEVQTDPAKGQVDPPKEQVDPPEAQTEIDWTKLNSKYPSGAITSKAAWNRLVEEYGEDALYSKGFFFGSSFSGTTKEAAFSYLEGKAVPREKIITILDPATWSRMKQGNVSNAYVQANDSYEDYLWNVVTDLELAYGK